MSITTQATGPSRWTLDGILTEQRLVNYPKILLAVFAVVFSVWVALTLATAPRLVDPVGKPFGYDFIATWSAGRLALEGHAADAYGTDAIHKVQLQASPGLLTIHPWPYPPPTQLFAAPWGLLPYPLAVVLFVGLSLFFWVHVVFKLIPDKRARWAALALPAGLVCFMFAQNAFLTAGLLALALMMLDRRPWLAGVLIGLLALKPHLGLLIPIALLVSGRWKPAVSAGAVVVTLVVASIFAFGLDAWPAFLHNLALTRAFVDGAALPLCMIPTFYVFAESIGASPDVAMAIQIAGALAAAACVAVTWRSKHVDFALKAATLCAASTLVSPYMFHYDLVLQGVAIGFLVMTALRTGFLSYERPILIVLWATPVVIPQIYQMIHVQLGAALGVALLGLLMRRAFFASSITEDGLKSPLAHASPA